MTLDDRHRELVEAMRGDASPEDIAARAEEIRRRITVQMASRVAEARAATLERCELELAEALGIDAEAAHAFGWATLIGMVTGVRAIGDIVLGIALPEVDSGRRRDLLVSFGAADYWSRVSETAERDGSQYRQLLGLGEDGRPLGDDPGAPGGGPR
jgi:hypothetical protein